MSDAMVTGRMSPDKKEAGNAVLQRAGLTASGAINLLYDLLLERGNADFLNPPQTQRTQKDWEEAADFVQSLILPFEIDPRFAAMTKAQVKMERLKEKGAV